MRHRHRDGSWVWLEVTNYNFLDDPARNHVATEMIDVSEKSQLMMLCGDESDCSADWPRPSQPA